MKSIDRKYFLWPAATLLAFAVAYLLTAGSIERLFRTADPGEQAAVPIVRGKIQVAGQPQAVDTIGKEKGPSKPAAGVTRAFFKPPRSETAEAVGLEITAVEQNGELVINGLLHDGSGCNRLQIDLELETEDGRKIYHTLILGDVGRIGEKPIRSKRRLPPSDHSLAVAWRAHVTALRCLDP